MTCRVTTALRNVEANAAGDSLNSGTIKFYTGAQPATGDTAASGTLMATGNLNADAFGAAANGVITANAIAAITVATGGSPGYARIEKAGGGGGFDLSCGTSGADIILNKASYTASETLIVQSLTYSRPTS